MQERQEQTDQATPELLYHYTTEKGLYGILQNDCIWANHYRFLNDFSEFQEFLAALGKKIRQLAEPTSVGPMSAHGKDLRKRFFMSALENVERHADSLDAYLVSFTDESTFSEPGDRLSQWRGYGQIGRIFSLGFLQDRLKSQVTEFCRSHNLPNHDCPWRCLYGEDEPSRQAKQAIVAVISAYVDAASLQPIVPGSDLERKLIEIIARFKNRGFCEEHELRFVLQLPVAKCRAQLVDFHDGTFGRTPHIAIPLGLSQEDSPLKRIVVGPAPDKEQSVARLRIDLEKLGIADVKVVPSQIPYRNW